MITRNGKAVAVVLAPADDDDLERFILARSPRFQALLEKSRRSIRAGKGLSRDAFWQAAEKRAQAKEGGHRTSARPPRSRGRARS